MADIGIQMLYSFVLAVVYGLASYLGNNKAENFNLPMFVKTLIVSVIVGAVMFYMRWDYTQALQFIAGNTVLMTFIDDLLNNVLHLTATVRVTVPAK